MINTLKYIRELEQVGFRREQAEAQVKMLIESIEDALATKVDLANLEERMNHRFVETEYRIITKLSFVVVTTITLAMTVATLFLKVG